ncbi:putative isopropanol dehydrogenase [Aspergillus ellipticus CBS 707.79]|uniref:Putative isopropanol dehydrogenase n=1 Tax=Aspergillus ellipticus CBS 707.79 TaxID=1448320 RepID=A0A319DBA7_9EURO|nr:putative isopropanol dehydrogenase [Aspergillus ellipticus CBS 707.79]
MSEQRDTMATHKALVIHSHDKPLVLETKPRPVANTGEAVVRILASEVVPYMSEILDGTRHYSLSFPMTPGNSAIGRVFEVGPDAVELVPGQLVLCDITIRARDNPSVSILLGTHGGGYLAAQKLMDGPWRNGTYAEFTCLPLENLFPLNKDLLMQRLGYTLPNLCSMSVFLVGLGGLTEVGVKPGEVVIIAPATGRYGGAAVAVALALGATVIAAGRNERTLSSIETTYASTGRLKTVVLKGDASRNTEAFRTAVGNPHGADVFMDFSPPAVEDGTLLTSAIDLLRPFGRCAIMGGRLGNITVPYLPVMLKSIRIQGRFMYGRSEILQMIRMVESGVLQLGETIGIKEAKEYGLESIQEALEAAGKSTGWGNHVVLRP